MDSDIIQSEVCFHNIFVYKHNIYLTGSRDP